MRVIARMNVGGPAYHVSLLSGRLDPSRYLTLLAHGEIGPGEASFAGLAAEEGCRVESVEHLGPEINPARDLRALTELVRLTRRFRPHIVHTHTAKAGALGRLATWLAVRPRPLIVHTYHGHVLEGYFGPVISGGYRLAERSLAKISDCLIGVSQATVDDLVRLGVASRERFRVIPLGLDLSRFADISTHAATPFRRQLGVAPDEVLVTCVGRLVPIKRVDILLRAFARARQQEPRLRLAIVGDGESRDELEGLSAQLEIDSMVDFCGFLTDVSGVAAAADIAALSSDNEGTPVSLIEAAAARVPAVATSVGGVADVVTQRTGVLVPAGDDRAMAAALVRLAKDPTLRAQMGKDASAHVHKRFSVDRLLRDVDDVYQELLSWPQAGASSP